MHWADKAEEQIERDYEYGEMTDKEYKQAMRDLREELNAAAQESAQDAYDNYY